MSPSLPRTVLVTGAQGLIGASLVRALLAREARVIALDDRSGGARIPSPVGAGVVEVRGDVRDRALLEALLADGPAVTAVVHLAARVGVRTILADPEGAAAENLDGVRSLVEALTGLPAARRPRVLAASSSEVYADGTAPLDEEAPLRRGRGGRWAYAAAKLAGERALDDAARSGVGAPPLHLRFFNVVGPGQDGASGMVLPRFVEAARNGSALEVHGDGTQVRTFAHVEDVAADLARLALGTGFTTALTGPLNLGGDARASVGELAELVAERARALGWRRPRVVRVDPVEDLGRSFVDVRHRVPDLARAAALGLATERRSLVEIVDDMLRRHPSRTSESARAPHTLGAAVNRSTRSRLRSAHVEEVVSVSVALHRSSGSDGPCDRPRA